MEIPQLIIDLAIMLTTAAVVTIVFKKLRIPTILGYIVAGLVMGSLVMEDVISVFMMVILTTIAAGQQSGPAGMAGHLALMICYLIIWLIGAHKDLSRIASHSVGKAGTHHAVAGTGNK